MDDAGVRVDLTYDSLRRLTQARRAGVTNSLGGFPTITTNLTYDACGRCICELVSAGGYTMSNLWAYNVAGQLTKQVTTNGLATSISYSVQNGQITATTLPSGASLVRAQYPDRRLKSITGSGGISEYHTYQGTGSLAPSLLDTVHYGAPDSARYAVNGYNVLRLLSLTREPDFTSGQEVETYYDYMNWKHQPHCIRTTGRLCTFNSFDFDGQIGQTSQGDERLASTTRITATTRQYTNSGGAWFYAVTNLAYLTDDSSEPTVTGVQWTRLSGFGSGSSVSEVTSWNADGQPTVVTTSVDRAAKRQIEVADVPNSTLNATNIMVLGLLVSESTPTVAVPTRHAYDALGREVRITNTLGFVAYRSYNQFGQVTDVADFTGTHTGLEYYGQGEAGAGQVKCETRANGKKTYYSYTARGELWRKWGDVPYPEERIYSDYGELTQLHTYRGGSDWNKSTWPSNPGAADTTSWTYQDTSGLLLSKTDASGRSVNYTYQYGRLLARTWARGATTTYSYNSDGDLSQLEYSDGSTVSFENFNRSGQPRQITDAVGVSTNGYDSAGRLVTTTYVSGLLAGVTVTNHFDPVYGRDSLQIQGPSVPFVQRFVYSSYGRLGTVSNGIYSATYGYLPDSDLLRTTSFKNNGSPVLTTIRSWEYGARLSAILNEANGAVVSSHSYRYDAQNRRTQAVLEDGSVWDYGYNDRDELVSARRFWPDWAPVSGQQFTYAYDNIGNRTTAAFGGDANGQNLRLISYGANNLNQYTSILTPGYANILGVALAADQVLVNTNYLADRKGEYFHSEIPVANTNAARWQSVSVSSGGTTTNGGFAFPANSQTLRYDADGNLTNDGIWTYEWDAENRLKAMWMTNIVNLEVSGFSNRLRLDFVYDYQGRRVSKSVSAWNGSIYTNASTTLFVYDGWNLLAELSSATAALRTYLWGLDLGGTMDSAGGIGGLLCMFEIGGGQVLDAHFAGYDGNGNVIALLRAGITNISAHYDYSPFGELLRATGQSVRANPFRFSTKYWDDEIGLLCYEHRYYEPSVGRWLGRDPAQEKGGINLYGFVLNRPIELIDSSGEVPINPAAATQIVLAMAVWVANGIMNGDMLRGEIDDDFLEWSERLIKENSGAPKPPRAARPPKVKSPRTISPTKARVRGWMQRGPWGGMLIGAVTGILAANDVRAATSALSPLTGTFGDFGGHLSNGESTWADLDAATFAAQLQSAGSDSFFTMGMLDVMLALGDKQ